MNVGPTLRTLRQQRQLTLVQAAEAAGMSVSHLSLIERNEREPSLTALDSLADALGVPVAVVVFLAARQERPKRLAGPIYDRLEAAVHQLMRAPRK